MKTTLHLPVIALFLTLSWFTTAGQDMPLPTHPAIPEFFTPLHQPAAGQDSPIPAQPSVLPPPRFTLRNMGVAIDPKTGMEVVPPPWKDTNWLDPDKTLDSVTYPSMPIKEIADDLLQKFNEQFDILLPTDSDGNGPGGKPFDWQGVSVVLRLKKVKASEVFNAMNLLFENDRTPLRWELKFNGSRRTALLRVLGAPAPENTFTHSDVKRVFFVGDLIGEGQFAGPQMKELVATIREVSDMAYNREPFLIQYHEKAQLLIVTGTPDQINFVQETLGAMRDKARLDRQRKLDAQTKAKLEAPKPAAESK